MSEQLKHLPKKVMLQQQAEEIVNLLRKKMLTAFDGNKYQDILGLGWVACGDYTKPELILIGFCIGGNLSHGTVLSLIRNIDANQFEEVDSEFETELSKWLCGTKEDGKPIYGAAYKLGKYDYKAIADDFLDMSNIWAICAAMVVALELPSHVEKLISILNKAIEEGYQETT